MPAQYDLLVAGEINPDLILSDPAVEARFGQAEILVQDAALTAGSSSVIFACGAAKLGLQVAFVGLVGDDLFGRFMLDTMAAAGVETRHVLVDPGRKTGLSVILNRGGDRAILTYLGAIDALRSEQVTDQLLEQARHLHVASYFMQTALQPGLPELFRRARRLGLSTSLDTNWDPQGGWAGVEGMLSLTDIFLPNAAEALAISGAEDVEMACAWLSRRARRVAVKLGAQGALAQQGDQRVRCPALPVDVMDTVGAGDSFDAGFVYAYLQGWSLKNCTRLGVACGSLSTRAHGGTQAQPTLAEALQALEAQ
ncbi:MAG: carbohydrate kinase family protein [Anaerolineales bacterium]|nr:carbohydrate kinase family protein [Anaerolineales bacterium]